MSQYGIFIDGGVCCSWGRNLPLHIFKTQEAPINGHKHCLNCGITKGEAREEERIDREQLIETRIFDINSDLENPKFIPKEELNN